MTVHRVPLFDQWCCIAVGMTSSQDCVLSLEKIMKTAVFTVIICATSMGLLSAQEPSIHENITANDNTKREKAKEKKSEAMQAITDHLATIATGNTAKINPQLTVPFLLKKTVFTDLKKLKIAHANFLKKNKHLLEFGSGNIDAMKKADVKRHPLLTAKIFGKYETYTIVSTGGRVITLCVKQVGKKWNVIAIP